jgi:subtilisin family serine protease
MKRVVIQSRRRYRGATVVAAVAALVVPIAATRSEAAPLVSYASATTTAAPAGALATVVVKMASPAVHAADVIGGLSAAAPEAAPQGRYLLRVPASQVPGVLARLRADPQVAYAEVPQPVKATVTPNNPCYVSECNADGTVANQAYLNVIGAPAAWNVTHGTGVIVAVLDSGVDATHPDLDGADGGGDKIAGNINICIDDDPLCAGLGDPLGHGTHVTGILAADTDNGIGVASLGWGVNVIMYKVLDSQGNGNTFDVATAIYDAVEAHVRVISMSLACSYYAPTTGQYDPALCQPDPDEGAAVEYALAHNVVVVAAAGNDGLNEQTYPASYPGVLSVAATNNNGVVQSFSQWGPAANIAAPGLNIVSTWPAGLCSPGPPPCYQVLSGTSMSTPQVAAAAALMIANDPTLSGPQITEILESTARPTSGGDSIDGGLLDVPAALAAEAHPPHEFNGYEVIGSDGNVYPGGSVLALGTLAGIHLNRPVVGMALSDAGTGYWLDASDGGVFAFGAAGFFGSTGGIRLNKPVVGMAATADGEGYWLVAADGGIFTFGDAGFFGSTGGIRLNQPIVGMAATPDGRGYWLVASDGGIFTFGDAGFFGSTGGIRLNQPIVGMAATPDGRGYWLVAADGGIFTFGDARFYGSTGGIRLAKPVVGMAATPDGGGYWLAASDGGIFTFGDARFWGSASGEATAPIVGVSS